MTSETHNCCRTLNRNEDNEKFSKADLETTENQKINIAHVIISKEKCRDLNWYCRISDLTLLVEVFQWKEQVKNLRNEIGKRNCIKTDIRKSLPCVCQKKCHDTNCWSLHGAKNKKEQEHLAEKTLLKLRPSLFSFYCTTEGC